MTQVEKRRNFIINVVYFVILLAFVALFLNYAFYPLLPIFIALIIALMLQRPMKFLSRKLKLPKALVATVLVLVVIAIVVLLFYAIGDRAIAEAQNFASHLSQLLMNYDWIHDQVYTFVDSLPAFIHDQIIDGVDEIMANLEIAMTSDPEIASQDYTISLSSFDFSAIFSKLSSGISSGVSGVIVAAKQLPSILIAIIICIILAVFMTIEYDDIIDIINRTIGPEHSEYFEYIRRVLRQTFGKLGKAYAIICSLTFIELTLGLTILKAIGIYGGSYILIIALITAILDILPVLGIGTVMWPWMAFCFFTGDTKMLLGLFVIYAIITVVRHIIEPKLISDSIELPAALTLSIMYIGLKFFGVPGMFLFIIILYCIVALNREGVIHVTAPPEEKTEAPGNEAPKELKEAAETE